MPIARIVLWITTLAALGLVARYIWFEPVAGFWGLLLMAWLVALVIGGVMNPHWEMFADVLWCAPDGKHGVAFTFDDGPHPKWTPRVLEVLREHSAKATFFVIGHKAEQHPELVRAIAEAGHSLGIHSFRHEYSYALKTPKAVVQDVQRCQTFLKQTTGQDVRWFRPPVGQISPRTADGAKRAKVTLVGWSLRARDGLKSTNSERVVQRIKSKLGDGAIVLLHDSPERGDREPASLAALPELLSRAKELGLQCVSLDQWQD